MEPAVRSEEEETPQAQLAFDVPEGRNLNSFLREGPVAAHLVLRSGAEPRILVAFPAGNSGVGLWFAHTASPVTWTLLERPHVEGGSDAKGRPLYGISASVSVTGGDLTIQQAVLSSVRVLRAYQASGTVPAEVVTQRSIHHGTITWKRDRLDGAAGYRLVMEITHGVLRDTHITPAGDGRIVFKIFALTGETPLTPLSADLLLNEHASSDSAARNTLSFLSYEEKFLAGSWRFNTYFGRDTLMSVALLMPVLAPAAVEDGLNAVLTRLSPRGEVAHEEDIGEYAILDHLHSDGSRSDAPTFNYNMIDADFMLAPVARAWLLEDERGLSRAAEFLAHQDSRPGAHARTAGADLVANLRFVIQSAALFAVSPQVENLIGLKPGLPAGEWRDSTDGLGGGHYPYDVNAALVPAALEAASRLYESGLLDPYLSRDDRKLFSRAAGMVGVWRVRAPAFFEVSESNEAAREAVKNYAAALGVPADSALASIGSAPLRFHALALKSDGTAVPVVNSDEGFALLFGRPDSAQLDEAVTSVVRPFPGGLLTEAGVLVANPVFAPPDVREKLTNHSYHGTVIWSWQQALLAEGLARQLRRRDLPESVLRTVRDAQQQVWRVIEAGRAVRNSELWSWTCQDGQFRIAPFGASGADVDESNAAQLWSTVYLAVRPPSGLHGHP